MTKKDKLVMINKKINSCRTLLARAKALRHEENIKKYEERMKELKIVRLNVKIEGLEQEKHNM